MTPKKFIKDLSEQDLIAQGLSQFTIDWVEDQLSEYHMQIEHMVLMPENEFFPALRYNIENVLNVMKPTLPDYTWFKSVLEQVESNANPND